MEGVRKAMRPLARYSLTGQTGDGANPGDLSGLGAIVTTWLMTTKGWNGSSAEFPLSDGRVAQVRRSALNPPDGRLIEWWITEPTADHLTQFQTHFVAGQRESTLAIYCELSAAAVGDALAPAYTEAKCPTVIRTLLGSTNHWFYGTSRASADLLVARGQEQGALLVRLICDMARRLPVVVVSAHRGLVLHPELAASLAGDLAALATVVQIDDEAGWHLTNTMGGEWCCRDGAVRLYWPLPIPGSESRQHPFWTPAWLLRNTQSVEAATWRFRSYLRRRLMDLSVFAVARPQLLAEVRESAARERQIHELAAAAETNEWESLARQFQQERDETRIRLEANDRTIEELRQRIYFLQTRTTFAGVDEDDALLPEQVPETIEQAVRQARMELAGKVVFGREVDRGIADLRPDAGPPEKALDYLRILGLMVEDQRRGELGNSQRGWLQDMGVTCTGESETIRNSATRMRRRVWHDGTADRQFEMHLKPNEALPPDRCVRIYFDWDDSAKQVVIGWIGRHPD